MVKIYLINEKTGKRSGEYVSVSFWSIFKANILVEIALGLIIVGVAFLIGIMI